MQESKPQPLNQDPSISKLGGLRFEVISVNHQLETLTDFLKSKGDLNSEITDLLLQAHNRQIIIEDNLSNFSSSAPGSHKEVSRLRELVAEFVSLKDEVLAAARRLGYEVEVEIGTKKGKETQKMKVARAEKEVEDLAAVFRKNFNRNPYDELPFQQARKALAAIKNNNVIETDYRIRALNKRAYYKSITKTIGEIKKFFKLKNVSLPGDTDTTKQVVGDGVLEDDQSVDSAALTEPFAVSTEDENISDTSVELLKEVDRSVSSVGVEGKKYDLNLDEIKAELSICEIEFKQLNIKFTEKFGEEIAREHLSKAQEILAFVSNENETDSAYKELKPHELLTELVQSLSLAEEQFNLLVLKEEEFKKLLSTVKTLNWLHAEILLFGDITEPFRKSTGYLFSKIESLREYVRQLISEKPEIDKSNIIELTFHSSNPEFSTLTNYGGLRDVVQRLVEEEVGIAHVHDGSTASSPDAEPKPSSTSPDTSLGSTDPQAYDLATTEPAEPDSAIPESIENPFSTVKTFEDLDEVLLGENLTEGGLVLLKSQIEKVRNEVREKKESGGDDWNDDLWFGKNALSFIGRAVLRITNYSGLRDVVKRLIEEENGIFVETVDSPTPEPTGPKTILKRDHENSVHRLELFARKETYLKKHVEYEAALKMYYEGSWRGRLRQAKKGVKNFFGLAPELPEDVMALKNESSALRLEYAKAMDAALVSRAKSREANNTYKLDADKTKKAFVEHFIMRPNQYSLNLQKEKLPPEVQSSLRRIMSYVGKTAKENKWKIRAGTIALASLAGLATGGGATMVAGGSLKLVKILASAKAGALAAGATNSLMQMRTKSATKNLDQEVNKFTLDNMLSSEATLVNAKRVVVSKEQQQAAATMAMGIMAGGLAGYEIGGANAEILREMSLSQPGEHEIPVPKPEIEKPVESAVKDSVPNASTENPIAAQITPEILAGEPFKLNDLHIVNEGLNKEYGATDIKNVNLMGSFKGVDLTPEEQKMINDVVKREAAILDYRPSMSEVQFEQYLFEKMRASLGQENWWIGAQPKGVDLDLSRIDPVVKDADVHVDTEGAEASKATETLKDNNSENPAAEPEAEKNTTAVVNTVTSPEPVGGVAVETAKASDLADPVTDSADKVPVTPEPVNENKYTVQKGDTLSDIVNEHFKDQLSKAPPGEYNKVLYKVLDNVNGSESLRNAVHISDIDHVYTNEELDLTAVGKEIERVLAEQSGDAITADGMEGADLATDKGIPTEVGSDSLSPIANDSGWRGYEATPEQKFAASGNPEILPPSKVVPVEGQYFNQPAWRDYVNQHFGNEVAFDRAVTAEVGYIDSLKSNWFDSLFGVTVYDSPYDVMKNMTVEELDELREAPDGERAFCEKHHLKYETYRDWQDRVAILKANYEWREDTTWADLFKRHVAEVKAPLLNKPAN